MTIDFHDPARPFPADEPMLKKDNLLSADQSHQWDTTENIRHRNDALLLCPMCLGAWPVVGDQRRFMIGQLAVLVMAITCLMIWILIAFWKNIVETIGLIQ